MGNLTTLGTLVVVVPGGGVTQRKQYAAETGAIIKLKLMALRTTLLFHLLMLAVPIYDAVILSEYRVSLCNQLNKGGHVCIRQ